MASIDGISEDSVQAQTSRILASGHFSRSQTLSRLLRFVVDQALEGKADELKEYRLGVDVFDRGQDFDPRVDPVVRMQAAKLRSRLAEYYSDEGRTDPLLITIPKGGYAPSFSQPADNQIEAKKIEPATMPSIAVLPFVNMSTDPENEHFADGLTEELINLLTTVPGLRVVARTSVFSFKNVAKDIREIGTQLNVQTVLEGSVRKAGNQLRVVAQLIEVSSGYHLLSRTYPRELKDVFAVQEELATAVVTEIMPKVRGEGRELVLKPHTADIAAYNFYLKGMLTLSKGFAGPEESVPIFQQALQIEPEYAPAFAGLAYAHFTNGWYLRVPPRKAMPLAKEAAQKALSIDPNLAIGHTILGAVQGAFEFNWAEAEHSLKHAISLQPSSAVGYLMLGAACFMPQARIQEALDALERALSLNPLDITVRVAATHVWGMAGDYEAAQEHYHLGVKIDATAPLLYPAMGLIHQREGQLDRAIASFQTACLVSSRSPIAVAALGNALAEAGDRAKAKVLLQEIASAPRPSPLALAILHLGLGNIDESMNWLAQAIEARESYVILIALDPRFAKVHGHPRFRQLLAQMHLYVP